MRETLVVDLAYLKAQAREAVRIYFAPVTFIWRLLRHASL